MEAEETAGYSAPCPQCSAVNWGLSQEGGFYCKSCHTLIERTREVVDSSSFAPGSSRVSQISRGPRTKRAERGYHWLVCEGFQFILKNQADALIRLGVSAHFKDSVLAQLWRLYLQKSGMAYCRNPERRLSHATTAQQAESSQNESDVPGSQMGNRSDWSGSEDAGAILEFRKKMGGRRRRKKRQGGNVELSMKTTLVLIHVALVWSRQPLTLSDLLRLVKDGSIPYVNTYQDFPDMMKVMGEDALLFGVKSFPSYQHLHQDSELMIHFLGLPSFPPIGQDCLLHPAVLSLRYLMDANLPDSLHRWVLALMECCGLPGAEPHTFNPASNPTLPRYDLQAAALVIIALKLLFRLDDHTEWNLSEGHQDDAGNSFSLKRWHRLMEKVLIQTRQETQRNLAKKQWRPENPIFRRRKDKYTLEKKKRVAQQIRSCFQRLSSTPSGPDSGSGPPASGSGSSFVFRWGDEAGCHGPSMHHLNLDHLRLDQVVTPTNTHYWHPALQPCDRHCFWAPSCLVLENQDLEDQFPASFVWVLRLFEVLLDVPPFVVLLQVLDLERRLLGCKTPGNRTRTKTSRLTETSTSSNRRGCETRRTPPEPETKTREKNPDLNQKPRPEPTVKNRSKT